MLSVSIFVTTSFSAWWMLVCSSNYISVNRTLICRIFSVYLVFLFVFLSIRPSISQSVSQPVSQSFSLSFSLSLSLSLSRGHNFTNILSYTHKQTYTHSHACTRIHIYMQTYGQKDVRIYMHIFINIKLSKMFASTSVFLFASFFCFFLIICLLHKYNIKLMFDNNRNIYYDNSKMFLLAFCFKCYTKKKIAPIFHLFVKLVVKR